MKGEDGEPVDYVVQHCVCIPNSDRWGSGSLGEKGTHKPDAAIRVVHMKNEACNDGLEEWRVMEVRRKLSTPDTRRRLPTLGEASTLFSRRDPGGH